MKLLQDLVPNCNKVTGKALMLDEILNYVQSLQRQVEFLSMKLASVDFNMDSLLAKDEFQPNGSLSHPVYPLDSIASAFFGHQTKEAPQVHPNFSIRAMTQCSVDPNIRRNNPMQPTVIGEFSRGLQQRDGGIKLVTEATCSGILNDLGSGSNVDVFVITKGLTEYLRNLQSPNQFSWMPY